MKPRHHEATHTSTGHKPHARATTSASSSLTRRRRRPRPNCRDCPIKAACADHALTHYLHGVWGGTSDTDRDRLRRRARRALR